MSPSSVSSASSAIVEDVEEAESTLLESVGSSVEVIMSVVRRATGVEEGLV